MGKKKNELLNILYRHLNSSNRTLIIKSLIILHHCLRKTFDPDVAEIIVNFDAEKNLHHHNDSFQMYIDQEVIGFYSIYLKKMHIYKDTFMFIKKVLRKIKEPKREQI